MKNKISVLHVISQFAAGGIEKWLVDFQNVDLDIDHEYLAISGKKGVWDENITGRIIYDPNVRSGKVNFVFCLWRYVRAINKRYDIVHIHLYRFSALVSLVFYLCGYRNIIVHAHNDKRSQRKNIAISKKIFSAAYGLLAKVLCYFTAKLCIAAGGGAGDDLFGYINRRKTKIIFCGVKLEEDICVSLAQRYSKEFSLNASLPLLHVGSFTEQKNHKFLIDFAEQLDKRQLDFKMILIGDGRLKNEIYTLVSKKGLLGKIIFAGNRLDVQAILQNVPGVFLFPSHFEGLGLALVEAQYCGRYSIVSDSIPGEAIVYTDAVCTVPLDLNKWSDTLSSIYSEKKYLKCQTRSMEQFDVKHSARNFRAAYLELLGDAHA